MAFHRPQIFIPLETVADLQPSQDFPQRILNSKFQPSTANITSRIYKETNPHSQIPKLTTLFLVFDVYDPQHTAKIASLSQPRTNIPPRSGSVAQLLWRHWRRLPCCFRCGGRASLLVEIAFPSTAGDPDKRSGRDGLVSTTGGAD